MSKYYTFFWKHTFSFDRSLLLSLLRLLRLHASLRANCSSALALLSLSCCSFSYRARGGQGGELLVQGSGSYILFY